MSDGGDEAGEASAEEAGFSPEDRREAEALGRRHTAWFHEAGEVGAG